ncbi:hypothetical protein OL548_00895 [Lysinibacillus sp. MHQ-1]|nr:hypothetical protein OL548_00895 [Lysinibacillus sp. MHQ-1]
MCSKLNECKRNDTIQIRGGGFKWKKNKPIIHTLAVGMPKELIDSKGRSMITGIEKQKNSRSLFVSSWLRRR